MDETTLATATLYAQDTKGLDDVLLEWKPCVAGGPDYPDHEHAVHHGFLLTHWPTKQCYCATLLEGEVQEEEYLHVEHHPDCHTGAEVNCYEEYYEDGILTSVEWWHCIQEAKAVQA